MKQITIVLALVINVSLFVSCGNNPSNKAPNSNTANTGSSNNPLETVTPTPEQTFNAAPTLSPTFKAYCEAMKKKDEAAIRKLYSTDTIAHFEKEMEAEGVKSLVKHLENDKFDKICEIRNEEIKGDTAVAEIRADWAPNGVKIVFVKENGEWKITNRSPALDNMKPSTANSSTAK